MLSKPDVKERFINGDVKSELVKWTGLIKEVGIQPE
jgi:hypothetical protein